MDTIDQLTPEEQDIARKYLKGLIDTMKKRKGLGSGGKLLSEEDAILQSLTHPERGDVTVKVLREKKGISIYISNPREPDNPYSVMSYRDSLNHIGRRSISGLSGIQLDEGDYGIYLITAQDRDIVNADTSDVISLYSTSFGISDKIVIPVDNKEEELKRKPYELCSIDDKWFIYKKGWDFDSRIPLIEKDLFKFSLSYARYKQPIKEEVILLSPDKYKESIGQIIRDIYPPNIQSVLSRDFPQDHKLKVREQQEILSSIKFKVDEVIGGISDNSGYKEYLKEVLDYVSGVALSIAG